MGNIMRRRVLAPELWSDGKVVRLGSDLGTLVWIALIAQTDDEGIVDLDPVCVQVSAHIHASIEDIEAILARATDLKLIVPYHNGDGHTFAFLPGFHKHQTLDRPTPTKHTRPPSELLDLFPQYVAGRRDAFNKPNCRHRGLFDSDESHPCPTPVPPTSTPCPGLVSDTSGTCPSETKRNEAKRTEVPSSPPKPAAPRKARAVAAGDPRVREFEHWWGVAFQERFKIPYVCQFAADGKQLKAALAGLDAGGGDSMAVLEKAAKRFLADESRQKYGGHTIRNFCAQLNSYTVDGPSKPPALFSDDDGEYPPPPGFAEFERQQAKIRESKP